MICPKCGANLSDGARFCPKCGSKIDGPSGKAGKQKPAKQPAKRPPERRGAPEPERYEAPEPYREPKKKGTPIGLIILMIILLLAVAGGGGFVAYRFISGGWGTESSSQKDEENDEKDEEEEEETQEEETEEGTEEETEAAEETESFWSDSPFEADGATSAVVETTAPSTTSARGSNPSGATSAWGNNPTNTTNAWDNNPSNSTTAASTLPAATGTGGYILPDSSSRQLTASDLVGLTSEQLRIARNEIYARHGRKFNDDELQAYFNSQTWYNGTIEPNQFDDMSLLSEIERKNLEVIKDREAVVNGTN